MMDNKNLISASEKLAAQIEEKLRALIPVSSGKLKESIKATVDESGNLVDIQIDGESYFKYVDQGRLKGTLPNLGAIQEWAQRRGIDRKKAFAIAVSIRDKGIEPKNILLDMEKDPALSDEGDTLANAYADDVTKHMEDLLNKTFK